MSKNSILIKAIFDKLVSPVKISMTHDTMKFITCKLVDIELTFLLERDSVSNEYKLRIYQHRESALINYIFQVSNVGGVLCVAERYITYPPGSSVAWKRAVNHIKRIIDETTKEYSEN